MTGVSHLTRCPEPASYHPCTYAGTSTRTPGASPAFTAAAAAATTTRATTTRTTAGSNCRKRQQGGRRRHRQRQRQQQQPAWLGDAYQRRSGGQPGAERFGLGCGRGGDATYHARHPPARASEQARREEHTAGGIVCGLCAFGTVVVSLLLLLQQSSLSSLLLPSLFNDSTYSHRYAHSWLHFGRMSSHTAKSNKGQNAQYRCRAPVHLTLRAQPACSAGGGACFRRILL